MSPPGSKGQGGPRVAGAELARCGCPQGRSRWPAEPPPRRARPGGRVACDGCPVHGAGSAKGSAPDRGAAAAVSGQTRRGCRPGPHADPRRGARGGWVAFSVRPTGRDSLIQGDAGRAGGAVEADPQGLPSRWPPSMPRGGRVGGVSGVGAARTRLRAQPASVFGTWLCCWPLQDARGGRQAAGGNREQGEKRFGRATHHQKDRGKSENSSQVKGDICCKQITSPKRSEKPPKNSGKQGKTA